MEERQAVTRVLDGGILSDFEGTDNGYFLGGKEMKALEEEWAAYFKCKYAVTVIQQSDELAFKG